MSDYIDDPRQCDAVRDELAELALGILSGRRRSEVLEHVATCPRCSAELDRLSIVADGLVQLAPEIEPPLGFELRLAERLQATGTVHRPRRVRRAAVLAVAAVVMVTLGFGLGTLTTPQGNGQSRSSTADLTSASLTSQGHVVGEVMVSAGHPGWVFMTVDSAWSGKVTCEVILAGGKVEKIGILRLSGGYGAWGAPLTSQAGKVRSALLITSNGTVLASAQIAV